MGRGRVLRLSSFTRGRLNMQVSLRRRWYRSRCAAVYTAASTSKSNEYLVEPEGWNIYEGVQKGIRLKDQDGDMPSKEILRPKITSPSTTSVKGSATAAGGGACSGCTVEVFIADTTSANNANGENYGQGKTFIGAGVTDSSGNFTVAVSGVTSEQIVTATVTDTEGNTSEFARNVEVRSDTGPTPTAIPPTTSPATPIPTTTPRIGRPGDWIPIVTK